MNKLHLFRSSLTSTLYTNTGIISLYLLLFACLPSCAYRTLEGRARPVYFSADPVVFMDTLDRTPAITFEHMKRLNTPCAESINLDREKQVNVLIAGPTIFEIHRNKFLVYPGEHIYVTADTADNFSPAFTIVGKNSRRNRELMLLKKYEELRKRPANTVLSEFGYESLLATESELVAGAAPTEQASQALFDSLCDVYNVSRRFKRRTRDYVHNSYDISVLNLYQVYRDSFRVHHGYKQRVRALRSQVNGVVTAAAFNYNAESNTNSIYSALFPDSGIRNMVTQAGGFEQCFDTIMANFTGQAQYYLLSRLMYRQLEQGSPIPPDYYRQYRSYSLNKAYRKIIARLAKQQKHTNKPVDPGGPTELLMADWQSRTTMQSVLADCEGKYVLVDLWASWCAPCLEEIPSLQALRNKYPADQIAFVGISVDTKLEDWIGRLGQVHNLQRNFLLLNKDSSALTRQIGLTTIPRYLIYNRQGKLIYSDAPRPSDPALDKLLGKMLLSDQAAAALDSED